MQHLKHRVAVPGTQVPGVQTAVLANVIQRLKVTIGKIDDVNVIAHTGAIDGGVVVAEHVQMLAAADCNLSDKWHQVVGNTRRILTDTPGFMRTHGVEVAQQSDIPAVIGSRQVYEHVFDMLLGAAVAGLCIHIQLLNERHGLGLAVHGCGR